jgi:drug/metabolite transporter superfamily protein YnfA
MNSRVVAIIVGLIILALGCAGLLYPERVMGVLGFSILNTSQAAAALGEVRATYGGLFVVMGVYTLLAALDPVAHRARLLFIGLMWLGAGAGRLLGVSINGNPGLPGWAAVVFEGLVGGALVAAAVLKPKTPAFASAPVQPVPQQP